MQGAKCRDVVRTLFLQKLSGYAHSSFRLELVECVVLSGVVLHVPERVLSSGSTWIFAKRCSSTKSINYSLLVRKRFIFQLLTWLPLHYLSEHG